MKVKKSLPDAVKTRTPTEKIVWMYIDRYPGQHSVRSIAAALGVTPARALAALVRDGLILEDEAPAGTRPGTYRAASLETPATPPKPGKQRKDA